MGACCSSSRESSPSETTAQTLSPATKGPKTKVTDMQAPGGRRVEVSARLKDSKPKTMSGGAAPSGNVEYVAENDYGVINKVMKGHFVFGSLSDSERLEVIKNMTVVNFAKNDVVFSQGSSGDAFFVIRSGKLEVSSSAKGRLRLLGAGDLFGELALLNNAPRSATVKVLEASIAWSSDRDTFRKVMTSISARFFTVNRTFLDSVPLFDDLTRAQKDMVAGALVETTFPDRSCIVQEGDIGNSLFIIKEGNVQCKRADGTEVRKLNRGDYFGERALMFDEPRSLSVFAVGIVKCMTIDRSVISQVFGPLRNLFVKNVIKQLCLTVPLFANLSEKSIDKALAAFETKTVNTPGAEVISARNGSRFVMAVLEGSVECINTTTNKTFSVGKGGTYGAETLAAPVEPPAIQMIAGPDGVTVSVATESALEGALGRLSVVKETSEKEAMVEKVFLLRHLPPRARELVAQQLQAVSFAPKDSIIREDEMGDTLFMIREGEVSIMKKGKEIRHMSKWDYFGERALLYDEPRTATVVAVIPTQCLTLHKSAFLQVVGPLLEHLEGRIRLQDVDFSLSSLENICTLGRGTFGLVKLAKHKQTGTVYAIKCVEKRRVVKLNQETNIKNERSLMSEVDHPFIVKYVRSFKDENSVYLLTEYLPGGELFDAIRAIGLLSRDDSRFYVGSILLALEYLHERNILYRDLKPENIMLDQDGYIKLVDFGCGKKVSGRTYTFVGTPEYLAPEVILGKGYHKGIDYWALGVMMYEFVCGPLPFGNDAQDQLEIFRDILEDKPVHFPADVDDAEAIDLIKKLLRKKPELRVGCSERGAKDIREHSWFRGFDFDGLLSRHVKAPKIMPLTHEKKKKSGNQDDLPPGEDDDDDDSGPGENHDPNWDADF